MVNILKTVIKEENKMSRDIIKTLNDRMNKLIKMVNRLPEGEQEFLEYISKFKAADGYYQLGSDRELCGGGSDSYYDFVVYPTYEVANRKIKKNPSKQSYKGLTYENMRNYVKDHSGAVSFEYKCLEEALYCYAVSSA